MLTTVTAQIGETDSGITFRELIVIMRKSLKVLEDKNYSDDVKKVKIYFRIVGEYEKSSEPTVIHKKRYTKNNSTVSAEIVVSTETWQHSNNLIELSMYLLKKYFEEMIVYLVSKRIEIDQISLMRDLENLVFQKIQSYK